MKKVFLLLVFVPIFSFSQSNYLNTVDLKHQIIVLQDSIAKLNQHPVMTVEQFKKIYRYENLLYYYNKCKKNPTKWKYFRSWATRSIETN